MISSQPDLVNVTIT